MLGGPRQRRSPSHGTSGSEVTIIGFGRAVFHRGENHDLALKSQIIIEFRKERHQNVRPAETNRLVKTDFDLPYSMKSYSRNDLHEKRCFVKKKWPKRWEVDPSSTILLG